MKRLIAVMFVVVGGAMAQGTAAPGAPSAPAVPAEKRVRVFVTDSDSWSAQSASGSGWAGFAGGFGAESSAGARPQTAEIIKTFGQRCPQFVVNNRPEMSDYVVRLEHEGGKGLLRKKDKVVVFVRGSGDSIFSDSTLSVGGSVQGACAAIEKHWAQNAGALSALSTPSPPAPVAVGSASLTVEANVPGTDIEVDGEFAGNAPSTLAVATGKHTITVKKKGYADWSRTMNVAGSAVRLSAELEAKP